MPNIVRTVGRSTTIKQYQQRGSEEDLISRAYTLYQILKVREVSQRKSLQGINDTAASSAEGFDTLANIVDELERCGTSHECCEGSRNHLRDCKRYRMTCYRTITEMTVIINALATVEATPLVIQQTKSFTVPALTLTHSSGTNVTC